MQDIIKNKNRLLIANITMIIMINNNKKMLNIMVLLINKLFMQKKKFQKLLKKMWKNQIRKVLRKNKINRMKLQQIKKLPNHLRKKVIKIKLSINRNSKHLKS